MAAPPADAAPPEVSPEAAQGPVAAPSNGSAAAQSNKLTETQDAAASPAAEEAAPELDEKAAMAKAILSGHVAASKAPPGRSDGAPDQGPDPRVNQARSIMSQAVARANLPPGVEANRDDDISAKLPPSHRQMLRGYFQDYTTGQWHPYFVGTLKSFSSKAGYGFLTCPQSFAHWGVDVFVHKNQVPVPWFLGQPVEFSVVANQRGQPQATDCNWLPRLPQERPRVFPKAPGYPGAGGSIFNPNAPSGPVNGNLKQAGDFVAGAPAHAAAEPPIAEIPAEPADPADIPSIRHGQAGPFYLGTMKSYSSAQGYGFFACEDLFKIHQRDIYFDRSQLPRAPDRYVLGQTVEFAMSVNGKQQPQARHPIWDPIPVLLTEPSKQTPEEDQPKQHHPAALSKLRKLLRLLNDNEHGTALVTAIDCQGGEKAPEEKDAADIDFMSFVLDRIGASKQTAQGIKDFVKMLLLLMLAKMLRKRIDVDRVNKFTRWLDLLATTIDPTSENNVQEHFMDVVGQIETNLRAALTENPLTQEQEVSSAIETVIQQLRTKADAHSSQPKSS